MKMYWSPVKVQFEEASCPNNTLRMSWFQVKIERVPDEVGTMLSRSPAEDDVFGQNTVACETPILYPDHINLIVIFQF